MKNIIIFISILFISVSLQAQKNVKVRINHTLNGVAFNLNTETTNSLGNKVKFSRVQYYLSNFKIVHDGGMETKVDDSYFLIDASQPVDLDLGMHNVTSIEKIIFSIGVDKDKNHLDPASYDTAHALSPKTPSMHWGWASGYRFVAIEGTAGTNFSKFWELHALGDNYYYTVYLPTSADLNGNELLITINADYSKSLSGIDVSGGMVVHGEENPNLVVLENFRDSVFSNANGVLEVSAMDVPSLEVYPNPSVNGTFRINENLKNQATNIKVYDLLGKEVVNFELNGQVDSFNLPKKGIYFVRFTLEDQSFYTQKLMVIN